jgi:hypothetical protein
MAKKLNTFESRSKLGAHFIYRLDKLTQSGIAKNLNSYQFRSGFFLNCSCETKMAISSR